MENQVYIAQASAQTSQPPLTPSHSHQLFDPGAATIWAALVTASLSSIVTIISLISNRRLMTRLEKERREHDLNLAKMQQKHEIQLENTRLRPERRLQFIGYWRKLLRNDKITYKDIFKDESYKSLEGYISSEVLQLIQQKLNEKQALSDHLSFKETAFNAPKIMWDDEDYVRGEHLAYENYYASHYSHLQPEEYDAVEREFENERKKLELLDSNLTKFMKKQIEEELRRLEKEEWELL